MADTITSVASLLWPLLVFVALMLFRRPLLRIARSAEHREWTLEVGGQKLSMKQLSDQQNSMIADLQKQIGALHKDIARLTLGDLPRTGVEAPPPLSGPAPPPSSRTGRPPQIRPGGMVDTPPTAAAHSVLWVDDHPENNALIVDQLQRNGVRVDLARGTNEALGLLGQRRYGVVLSDMGRVEEGTQVPDAGLRLLKMVRRSHPTLPFVIYCSLGASRAYTDRALAEGATAITSSPAVLSERLQSLGMLE